MKNAKTLIGLSTFGNLAFTQLTINSIRATTRAPIDFFVVVGKPGDVETAEWLHSQNIPHKTCHENMGFPVALNDIMEWAWHSPCIARGIPHYYDNLIIAGNDIVPYPRAVDALIEAADHQKYEWFCSSQYDVKSLVRDYPDMAQYFAGPNLNFDKWGCSIEAGVKEYLPLVRPWEAHQAAADRISEDEFSHSPADGDWVERFLQADCIKDVRNLCLFKRSVFEKIGFADVNFWPGGYFEDNDYCKRARLAGVKACGLRHSAYFHFWSRTIHQGDVTSARQFQNNSQFYQFKWGGPFDAEKFSVPWDGHSPYLDVQDQVVLHGGLKISGRADEAAIVKHWRGKA